MRATATEPSRGLMQMQKVEVAAAAVVQLVARAALLSAATQCMACKLLGTARGTHGEPGVAAIDVQYPSRTGHRASQHMGQGVSTSLLQS